MAASGESVERKIQSELPAYLSQAFKEASERALNLSRQEYQRYPGDRLAPISPLSRQAIDLSRNTGAYAPDLNKSYDAIRQADAFFPQRRQEYLAPYQQAVVQNIPRNAQRTYQEGFLPELQSRFFKPGQAVRSRHANLPQDLNISLQREIGNQQAESTARGHQFAMQGFDSDRARAQEASKFFNRMGLSRQQAQMADLEALKEAGSFSQNQRQRNLDLAFEQWKEQQRHPYERLASYFAALQGMPYAPSTYTKSETPRQPYPAPDWRGMGMGVLGNALGNELSSHMGTMNNFAGPLMASLISRVGQAGGIPIGMPSDLLQQGMMHQVDLVQERNRKEREEKDKIESEIIENAVRDGLVSKLGPVHRLQKEGHSRQDALRMIRHNPGVYTDEWARQKAPSSRFSVFNR
jgi:hypothetical protein